MPFNAMKGIYHTTAKRTDGALVLRYLQNQNQSVGTTCLKPIYSTHFGGRITAAAIGTNGGANAARTMDMWKYKDKIDDSLPCTVSIAFASFVELESTLEKKILDDSSIGCKIILATRDPGVGISQLRIIDAELAF